MTRRPRHSLLVILLLVALPAVAQEGAGGYVSRKLGLRVVPAEQAGGAAAGVAGLRVEAVETGGFGDGMGLLVGDILQTANSVEFHSLEDFQKLEASLTDGMEVVMWVQRNGSDVFLGGTVGQKGARGPSARVHAAIFGGQFLATLGDLSGAVSQFQKALELKKDSSLAHYRIAEVYFLQRDYQAAANAYRDAINGDGEPHWTAVWSHIQLGKIFDIVEQRGRATNEYNAALATQDNTKGALDEALRYLKQPYQPPTASPAPASAPAGAATTAASGKLLLTTTPVSAQVYLDDEFKGTSGEDGKLVIAGVAPGAHTLRLTNIGYKEWKQALQIAAGDNSVAPAMESAGPKPLALSELLEALRNGVPKTRVTALVKQFGVDFEMSESAETQLRSAGADDPLLLTISKSHRH